MKKENNSVSIAALERSRSTEQQAKKHSLDDIESCLASLSLTEDENPTESRYKVEQEDYQRDLFTQQVGP